MNEQTETDLTLRKVLLVDDDMSVRMLVGDFLQNKGFSVTTASEPLEGLDLVKNESFAVIVSDYEMPNLTGLEFLEKAREINPAPTRVLLSGNVSLDKLVEASESGLIYRFMMKPWIVQDLLVTVRNSSERFAFLMEIAALKDQIGGSETNVHG